VTSTFAETDLFAQQERNRRRSRWVVTLFIAFFVWLGLGADLIRWLSDDAARGLPLPWLGLLLGGLALGLLWHARRHGAERVLWSAGAWQLLHPATPEQQRFVNVAEEMAIAASLPVPTLWIIDDDDPNAFATGLRPDAAHIAVTSGLLERLDRDELQGVLAHELGHVRNHDTQLMTLLAALVGAVLLLRDGIGRSLRHGGRALGRVAGAGIGRAGGRGGKQAGPVLAVLVVVWVLSWMLAPLVLQLLSMWVSREREFLADAMAAQFTRNPLALASALEKIHASHSPTHAIQAGVAHLCIADPLGRRIEEREGALADLFATHPPMALRIARLRALGFQHLKREGRFPVAGP
jgi:heat shock protein HtpX